MAEKVHLPEIAGVTWEDLDDEEVEWNDMMREGMKNELTRTDVDNMLGPVKPEKQLTAREQKFIENDVNLLVQLDKRRNERTPDFLTLKLEEQIPVIVYGTLKQDGMYHSILQNSPYVGPGLTVEPKFVMMETQSFPVVLEAKYNDKGQKSKRGKIRGEVYMVDAKVMLRLDELEANGSMYTRKKTWVKLLEQGTSGFLPAVEAWIYIGNEEFFDNRYLQKVTATHNGNHLIYDWDATERTYAA